jgi:hypothetical protein
VKVRPFAKVAVMEPETLPRPVQPNFTGFVPDTAAPEPVLVVAQPAASPMSSSNPTLEIIRAMLYLQWLNHLSDSDDSYSQTCPSPRDVNTAKMDCS